MGAQVRGANEVRQGETQRISRQRLASVNYKNSTLKSKPSSKNIRGRNEKVTFWGWAVMFKPGSNKNVRWVSGGNKGKEERGESL